jgi:hypothetical protein
MENSISVSAIVVIVDSDVHSVYLVPCKEAMADKMSELRALKDKLLKKHSRTEKIRIQRVWVSDADRQAQTFDDVSKQLENIIHNL